jgi:hypothetical protein
MKKKLRNLVSFAIAAVALSACVPSVWPYFRAQDTITDDRLLGEWQAKSPEDEPGNWKFEQGDGKDYKLTVTDKDGKTGTFSAHLFKLKQEMFLDLLPTNCQYASTQADLVANSMFPGHLLARVPRLAPNLQLAFLDFDWLGKYLDEHPKAVANHKEENSYVLTAETEELQKFVLAHLAEGELFKNPGDLARKPK